MDTLTPENELINHLIEHLVQLTKNYWLDSFRLYLNNEINVFWNIEVYANRQLSSIEREALHCLKCFEGCFVRLRHLDNKRIDKFEELCHQSQAKYTLIDFINYESDDKEITNRRYRFHFKLNYCYFNFHNEGKVPHLTVTSILK